jgi:hypothetical protein
MPRLAGHPLRGVGYHPRHRSPRWDKPDQPMLADLAPVAESPLADLDFSADNSPAEDSSASSDCEDDDFLGEFTRGQLRRILEGSAINQNLAASIPDLVHVVAHSSHTSETLASAWTDFQRATRDAHALRIGLRAWWEFFRPQNVGSYPQAQAVEIKLNLADRAWSLITNGAP